VKGVSEADNVSSSVTENFPSSTRGKLIVLEFLLAESSGEVFLGLFYNYLMPLTQCVN
jgi:hypothetical protein